jgi:ABC-type Fe3+/spermidine/putrescine transport system ATPase subunit
MPLTDSPAPGADLKLELVRKQFGSAAPAVAGLDLHVSGGESIVLLGPSGCGKTTTLRMVAGFERPTSGSIAIGDRTVAAPGVFVPPERREVGVVFQSYALWPHMTVADNIAFGLTVRRRRRASGDRRADVKRKVDATLEQVQLGGLGNRYPHEISGGQQQRVALARALVTDPRVLLLDEPLSNLDTRLREDMRLEIRRIQRESGITMIYITHDRIEALALADRIVALRQGETQQMGSPESLYRQPRNEFVALSLGAANFLPATVQAIGRVPVLKLATGQVVDAVGANHKPLHVGDEVVACIRPADIVLEKAAYDAGTTAGVVREATFLGDEVHYIVDVPGIAKPMRVVQRAEGAFGRDARVTLVVAQRAASVLEDSPALGGSDAATGRPSPTNSFQAV